MAPTGYQPYQAEWATLRKYGFIHSFIYPSIHPSIHPFMYVCIHACIHSFILLICFKIQALSESIILSLFLLERLFIYLVFVCFSESKDEVLKRDKATKELSELTSQVRSVICFYSLALVVHSVLHEIFLSSGFFSDNIQFLFCKQLLIN